MQRLTMLKFSLPLIAALFFIAPQVHAATILPPTIKILHSDGTEQGSFLGFSKDFVGGLSVAVGDLGNDHVAEIVVGSGIGEKPTVKILRQDGSEINSFLAYAPAFVHGIHVAIGDVDGDGVNEIITSPAYGGSAHIRIFDQFGQPKYPSFFAFPQSFHGGAFVTLRDLNNDGAAEIIVGAGASGGPHVKIFKADGTLVSEFFAFDANDTSGVTVGTADVDADGIPEILVSRASSDPPEVKFFKQNGNYFGSIFPFPQTFRGGTTPVGADLDRDGHEEIIIAPNGGVAPVEIFNSNGTVLNTLSPFGATFDGSVSLSIASLDGVARPSLVVAPSRPIREGPIEIPKFIRVNLSEQRLYAYTNGLLEEDPLVSTGIARYPTPPGTYTVLKKIPIKDYIHSYGPGSPDNYTLYNVKWNLMFRPGYYLHYAYWHHDFGHRRSHGCVNLDAATAEWIYNWGEVGTPVSIVN